MKKEKLKTGMRVETRDGVIYLVIKDVDTCNYGHQDIAFVCVNGFVCGNQYDDNLNSTFNSTCGSPNKGFDIVKVYQINNNDLDLLNGRFMDLDKKYLIWKHQDYTGKQREVFKALKVLGFNWIACDKDNGIYTYEEKPTKSVSDWYMSEGDSAELCTEKLKNSNFDFIKWEDAEPFEIPTL